jgi:hypothetical protein
MGGRMFAESKGVGRGATFHILLPVSAIPAAESQTKPGESAAA